MPKFVIHYMFRQEEKEKEVTTFIDLVDFLYDMENFTGGYAYRIDNGTRAVFVRDADTDKWINSAGRETDFNELRNSIRK